MPFPNRPSPPRRRTRTRTRTRIRIKDAGAPKDRDRNRDREKGKAKDAEKPAASQGAGTKQGQSGAQQQSGKKQQQSKPHVPKPVAEKRIIDTRGSSNTNLSKYDEKFDKLAGDRGEKQRGGKEKINKNKQRQQNAQTSSKRRQEERQKLQKLHLEIAKKAPTKVLIPEEISVQELASRMKKTGAEVVKCLIRNGVMASLSQIIDFDTAAIIAEELGCVVERDESWLERFKEVLQNIAQSGDGYVFMDSVSSSLYNEDILAFTPHGKGIILPKGATALDFAFEVHTEIGDHAKFARINGALSPIKTVLHRGDCVEIGTSEDVVAKPEWLSYAKTYKARRRLHDLLRNSADEGVKLCTECTPLPGEEVIGFKDADGVITVHSRHCPVAIKLASENGSSIVSVNFEPKEGRTYPVSIRIVAIDRYHLLRDIIDCFVERQHLSMNKLSTSTEDEIVECIIDFPVHSVDELQLTISSIAAIPGVDEVHRIR